jgi:1,4-dihydroxy-2-naphthoate octaprenyltransferase
MAMLVIGILHANNWRDIVTDKGKKVFTMACLLADRGSLVYYGLLLFGSMILVILYILVPRVAAFGLPALPPTFLIVFFALPKVLGLWKRALNRHAPEKPLDFAVLDGATATYNLLFGLLCTAALWLDFALKKL